MTRPEVETAVPSRRWMGLLPVLALVVACGDRPQDGPRWREQWELLGLAEDGSVIDARLTVGNTGLLRGQGHMRVDRWFEERAPVLYGRDVGPAEVEVSADRRRVMLGLDGLTHHAAEGEAPERITLQARDQEASAAVHAAPRFPLAEPPATRWQEGGGEWAVEALAPVADLSGWLSGGERGGLVTGRGVVLHRGGDGYPAGPRTTFVALGHDLAVGIDQHGAGLLAWGMKDGRIVELGAPETFDVNGWPRTVSFRDGPELTLRRDRARGERLPFEHLTQVEQRLLAWGGLWKVRRVVRAIGTIRWGDQEELAPALWVRVLSDAWSGGHAVLPEAPDAASSGADAPGRISRPPAAPAGAAFPPE
ncbi:MAG: hypothetical protein H6742_09830 [Alphaproteobacteria bacterium]|nr:hypothetical protein [Alphaproteobacteria bacterium]